MKLTTESKIDNSLEIPPPTPILKPRFVKIYDEGEAQHFVNCSHFDLNSCSEIANQAEISEASKFEHNFVGQYEWDDSTSTTVDDKNDNAPSSKEFELSTEKSEMSVDDSCCDEYPSTLKLGITKSKPYNPIQVPKVEISSYSTKCMPILGVLYGINKE